MVAKIINEGESINDLELKYMGGTGGC